LKGIIVSKNRMCLQALIVTTMIVSSGRAVVPDKSELERSYQWFEKSFIVIDRILPFSFEYGGVPSSELLKRCTVKDTSNELDKYRTQRIIEWSDPNTGLLVKCSAVAYSDYPTVEWTVYIENKGTADSPLLKNIQALDAAFTHPAESSEFVLHHFKGGSAFQDDYQPLTTTLTANMEKVITPFGGRPTNDNMCYFNLEMPGPVKTEVIGKTAIWQKTRTIRQLGDGVIIALGWPGQWSIKFNRNGDRAVKIAAGQETTNFILHPGERVRSPLVALQFYTGEFIRSQNIWRKWMREHNLPKLGGKVPTSLFMAASSHQFTEMTKATEKNQIQFVNRYIEEGLKPDYWWMDAGWYKLYDDSWVYTGTWEIDPNRFPRGFKPISDNAHAKGVKILVWFEPERVTEHTWLWDKHPEWLLSPKAVPDRVGWMRQWKLLNLGNPETCQWLINHVDTLMKDNGIDLYRQDFNIDPLFFWRGGDSENRQGITENFYVQGYLAYFDELVRRHSDMIIDSCASGGRRNDLETMRRALPFIRSDYIVEPIGQQGHMYGISMWLPFFGTCPSPLDFDMYNLRSIMAPLEAASFEMRDPNLNYESIRTWYKQWRAVSPYYAGDYYPLTDYSISDNTWIAWQFDRPDLGEGVIQAFRRPNSPIEACRFPLKSLDSKAQYEVHDLDSSTSSVLSGKQLMEDGLAVSMLARPSAVIITYKKVTQIKK
jgi:alpha-galactosidase